METYATESGLGASIDVVSTQHELLLALKDTVLFASGKADHATASCRCSIRSRCLPAIILSLPWRCGGTAMISPLLLLSFHLTGSYLRRVRVVSPAVLSMLVSSRPAYPPRDTPRFALCDPIPATSTARPIGVWKFVSIACILASPHPPESISITIFVGVRLLSFFL